MESLNRTPVTDELPASPPEPDPLCTGERRRPDRIEAPSPHLIALLRGSIPSETHEPDWKGSLGPARGIAFGLLLVAPFWVGVAGVLWLWFRR